MSSCYGKKNKVALFPKWPWGQDRQRILGLEPHGW